MMRIIVVLLIGLALTGKADASPAKSPQVTDPSEAVVPPRGSAETSGTTAVPPPEQARKGNPLWDIPLRLLTETRARPLLSPSRRPPPPVVAAVERKPPPPLPPPAEPEKPELSLIGTVIGDDVTRIGIFRDNAGKNVLRLKTGEDHQGWILRVVQRQQVMLAKGARTAVLTLPPPETKKPGPVPPGATAAFPAPFGAPPPTPAAVPPPQTPPKFPSPPVASADPTTNPIEQAWLERVRNGSPQGTLPIRR